MVMSPEFTLLYCYLNSLFMFKYKKFEATTTLPRTLGFSRSNLVTLKMQCSQRMAEMHPQHKKFDVKITKTDNQPNLPAWFFVRPSHKLKGTLLPCKVMGSCEDFSHCQNTCYNIRVRSSSTSCIVKLLLSLAEV